MLRFLRITLCRILAIAFLFSFSFLGFAQSSVKTLDDCWSPNSKHSGFKITYYRLIHAKPRKPTDEGRYVLRLHNQSRCSVYIPTWNTVIVDRKGRRLDHAPQNSFLGLTYFTDGAWTWGDSLTLYVLRPGLQIRFEVPIQLVRKAKFIEVPIKLLDDDTPIISEETYKVRFNLNDLLILTSDQTNKSLKRVMKER